MGRPKQSNPTMGVTIRLSIITVAQLKTEGARLGKKFNTLLREILESHVSPPAGDK